MVDASPFQVGVAGVDRLPEGLPVGLDRHIGDDVEGRFQAREPFGGGFGPGEFLVIERDAAILIVNGDEAFGEAAFADCNGGAALAFQTEGIDGFAADALHRGDGITADTLMRLRVQRLEGGVARPHAHRHDACGHVGSAECGGVGHHFGAPGDQQVFHPGHDLRGGEIDAGDAAAAEAVQRHAAGADVIARRERRHPAKVPGLLAALGRGRPDDVIDMRGIEIVAVLQRLQHGGGEMLRVQVGQRALAGFANTARGANGVDDVSVGHRMSSQAGYKFACSMRRDGTVIQPIIVGRGRIRRRRRCPCRGGPRSGRETGRAAVPEFRRYAGRGGGRDAALRG